MTGSLDFAPLTQPVDRDAFRAWVAGRRRKPEYADGSLAGRIVLGVMISLIAVPIVAFLVVIGFGLITSPNQEGFTPTAVAGLSVGLLVVLTIAYGLIRGIRSWLRGFGTWKRWYRLERFAAANGLTFSPRDDNPRYPGSVFEGGTSSALIDHLRSRGGDGPDYGTAWRITKAGNRTSSEEFAFIALRLDRTLPHMMLDAKRNRSRTAVLRREQILSRGRRLRRALSASGIALAILVVLLPFLPLIVDTTTG